MVKIAQTRAARFFTLLGKRYPTAAAACGQDLQKWKRFNELRPVHRMRVEGLLEDTSVLWKHRMSANRQLNAFHDLVERIKEGFPAVLVLLDFKENFKVGGTDGSAVSVTGEHHLGGAVSCLGFTVWLPGRSQALYCDYLSGTNGSHSSQVASQRCQHALGKTFEVCRAWAVS